MTPSKQILTSIQFIYSRLLVIAGDPRPGAVFPGPALARGRHFPIDPHSRLSWSTGRWCRQKIGQVEIGPLITTWLWLPFILFWLWNVLDARGRSPERPYSTLFGVLFAAVILYVIAWNVTDVKLDRLVTRFHDARTGLERPCCQPGYFDDHRSNGERSNLRLGLPGEHYQRQIGRATRRRA